MFLKLRWHVPVPTPGYFQAGATMIYDSSSPVTHSSLLSKTSVHLGLAQNFRIRITRSDCQNTVFSTAAKLLKLKASCLPQVRIITFSGEMGEKRSLKV